MSELKKGFVRQADSAESSDGEPVPARTAYEPPRLRALGTLAELIRGSVPSTTDGILPGSVLDGPVTPPQGAR